MSPTKCSPQYITVLVTKCHLPTVSYKCVGKTRVRDIFQSKFTLCEHLAISCGKFFMFLTLIITPHSKVGWEIEIHRETVNIAQNPRSHNSSKLEKWFSLNGQVKVLLHINKCTKNMWGYERKKQKCFMWICTYGQLGSYLSQFSKCHIQVTIQGKSVALMHMYSKTNPTAIQTWLPQTKSH